MRRRAPFAFDSDRTLMLTTDDREIIAFDVSTLERRWIWCGEETIVGLGPVGERIVVAGDRGAISLLNPEDGALISCRSLGRNVDYLATCFDSGWVALAGDDAIIQQVETDPVVVSVRGATCVAISVQAGKVAVGTLDGHVRLVSLTGEPIRSVPLKQSVADVAWSPRGFWLAGVGQEVFTLPDADEPLAFLCRVNPDPVTGLAVSENGRVVAVNFGERSIGLVDAETGRACGIITYLDIDVGQAAFGNVDVLGVGLGHGEANRINLCSSDGNKPVQRTQVPEDRPCRAWKLSRSVDRKTLRRLLLRRLYGCAIAAFAVLVGILAAFAGGIWWLFS